MPHDPTLTNAAGTDGGDYMSNMDLPPSSSDGEDEEEAHGSKDESETQSHLQTQSIHSQYQTAAAIQADDTAASSSGLEPAGHQASDMESGSSGSVSSSKPVQYGSSGLQQTVQRPTHATVGSNEGPSGALAGNLNHSTVNVVDSSGVPKKPAASLEASMEQTRLN